MTIEFLHKPGCDQQHTARQACHSSDVPDGGFHFPRAPKGRVLPAIAIELATAGVGIAIVLAVSAWEPVEPGILPPVWVRWTLAACILPFLVGGLGWFCVGALRTAWLVMAVRFVVALIMVTAVAGAHLYGCESEPPAESCVSVPSDDEMGVHRASRNINIGIPLGSAALIAVWGVISAVLPPQRPWAERSQSIPAANR
jgi:hypothetical protein